jgi:hypothetical protein
MTNAPDETRATKMPPYVSYKTLTTFIHDLQEHGIPTRIDRSVLTRFSGVVGTQLMTALRFLGLIDGNNQPTDRLRKLVEAHNTPDWGTHLGVILRGLYSPLFSIDLATATPSHFNETFKNAFPGSDAVVQKSVAFFVQASKDAGIVISERVLKGKKPRGTNGTKKRAPKTASEPLDSTPGTAAKDKQTGKQEATDQQAVKSDFMNQLLAKFPPFDPAWSPELQAEWFKGFQTFMVHAKEGQK